MPRPRKVPIEPKPRPRRSSAAVDTDVAPVARSGGEKLGGNPRDRGEPRTRIELRLEGKMAKLHNGEITVADMDNEELARLQFKDKNGRFTGRKPNNLPAALVNMMRKELIDRASEVRRSALEEANKTLVSVIRDTNAKDADRIKAALALIEREEGKVPDRVDMTLGGGDKPIDVAVGMVRVVRGARPSE